MGNQVTIERNARPASESITELTNITLKDSLGGGRVLKTFLCVHDDGLVVVKVHQRKGDMDLSRQREYYLQMRDALRGLEYPHVFPYQIVQLTPRAGYLVRQYIYSNLHDRLTTRPFLTRIEKLWISFQLLHAVGQLHEHGYCHGDIKSDNVLVTSWNWVFLTDMAACYKPVMLPAENPVDFSFFYDVQGKRVCYIAPERFYDGSKDPGQDEMELLPSMDIFSLGCVIAELYLDGKDNLHLSQLLQYRKGEYDPMKRLDSLGDAKIQRLIAHMTQLQPQKRLTAQQYLTEFEGGIFPQHFHSILHPFFRSLLRLDSESRVQRLKEYYWILRDKLMEGGFVGAMHDIQEVGGSKEEEQDSGAKSWFGDVPVKQFSGAQIRQEGDTDNATKNRPQDGTGLLSDIQNLRAAVSNLETKLQQDPLTENGSNFVETGEVSNSPFIYDSNKGKENVGHLKNHKRAGADDSIVLITVLLCTMVCGAKQQDSKLAVVRMLYDAAGLCDEDIRLQRAIPYLLSTASGGIGVGGAILIGVSEEEKFVSTFSAKVKCVALRCVVRLLRSIQSLPVSDARIFAEYVMPSLSLLPGNDEEIVRVEYACALPKLAATAHRFLMRVQFLHSQQEIPEGFAPGVSYDQELEKLRTAMAQIIMDMLQSQLASSAAQGMLQYLDSLAEFFGSSDADLMPVIISLLNHQDWQLRASFYRHIVRLAKVKGPRALMQHILPLLDNALSDSVFEVATQAVLSVTYLISTGGLDKPTLLVLAKKFLPFLGYSQSCLKAAALASLAAIAKALPAADTYARLLPTAEHYFLSPPLALDDADHLIDYLTPQEDVKEAEGQRTIQDVARSHLQYIMSGGTLRGHPLLYPSSSPPSPTVVPLHSTPSYYVKITAAFGVSHHQAALLACEKQSQTIAQQTTAIQPDYIGASQLQSSCDASPATVMAPNISPEDIPKQDQQFLGKPTDLLSEKSPDELTSLLMQHASVSVARTAQYSQVIAPNSQQLCDVVGEGEQQVVFTEGVLSEGEWTVDTVVRGGGWKPRGVLIGHMAEHRRGVNRIAVCEGGDYFVSASDDGDVKVWDCRRLEHVITFQSRLTYSGHKNAGRVVAVACCHRQNVASASSDGSIHLWQVDYYSKSEQNQSQNVFVGCNSVTEITKNDEGGITEMLSWGSLLLYSTQKGVYAYDTRIERDVWSLKSVAREGIVRRMAGDPVGATWIVTGTSQGVCTLWDVRFQLPVHVWAHPSGKPVESLLPAIAPAKKLGLQKGDEDLGPLLYMSCGGREIELWSLQERRCVQVLRCADSFGDAGSESAGLYSPTTNLHVPADAPPALTYQPQQGLLGKGQQALSSDSTALYNHLKLPSLLEIPRYKKWGVRALLPFTDGPLLSAGTDRSIRYWDGVHVDKSYVVCAPPQTCENSRPNWQVVSKHQYQTRMYANVPVIEERILAEEPNLMSPSSSMSSSRTRNVSQSAREIERADLQHMQNACHSDAILHMSVVELSDKVLLSAGRDGVIKAWK